MFYEHVSASPSIKCNFIGQKGLNDMDMGIKQSFIRIVISTVVLDSLYIYGLDYLKETANLK